MTRSRWFLAALLFAAAGLIGVGCSGDEEPAAATSTARATPSSLGSSSGSSSGRGPAILETATLSIHDAYIPAPPSDIGALYFTMVDRDGEGDRLMSASTSAAAAMHFHFTEVEDGTSRMLPVEGGIVLPPRGATTLEPSGLHVMLMSLTGPLLAGDTVEVTLQFQRAGTVVIQVPVLSYAEVD